MMMWESWTGILGSLVATLMFCWPMLLQYFSPDFRNIIEGWVSRLMRILFPKMEICFNEYRGGRFSRNEAYDAIEGYLTDLTSARGRFLKAHLVGDSTKIVLSLDDGDEIIDNTFEGIVFRWSYHVTISSYRNKEVEKHMFKLSFHEKHREVFLKRYLDHVIKEGQARVASNRQPRLYTNDQEGEWNNNVSFLHPATFDNLAMDPEKKEEIIKDLIKFSESKDYYARMGKAWKRGYLLYGPPGTGKTTMIASMANLLHYDVYDLELTTVTNNTELRKLLIDTEPKSIIVIEDIDCSLHLTGQRRKKEKKDEKKEEKKKKDKKESSKSFSQVTLSGLLNFIDGLWSACGEERIIVFTTNHVDQLDPALIRSGRMDFHIEMSYCCFEAFKVLARTYLGVESHPLFDTIRGLLEEIEISPADVAENLMPKTFDFDATTPFQTLIRALNKVAQHKKDELVEIMEEKEDEEDEEEEDDQTETDKDSDDEE